jgi:hypothetical protein
MKQFTVHYGIQGSLVINAERFELDDDVVRFYVGEDVTALVRWPYVLAVESNQAPRETGWIPISKVESWESSLTGDTEKTLAEMTHEERRQDADRLARQGRLSQIQSTRYT